jgi:hypothetical protein
MIDSHGHYRFAKLAAGEYETSAVVERNGTASAEVILAAGLQFAGQTAHYQQVPLELKTEGNEKHISGTIPTTLTDFKIEPPSLLTMPVKNDIPVHVEMTWSPQ